MRVFIGSSKECTGIMAKVAYWLEQTGCQPQRWDEPGLFRPGEYIFQALLAAAQSVDAAILIFGEDDITWRRGGALVPAPRDNVLLEYGLFAAILGPKRTLVCRVGSAKTPTDIDGIVYLNLTPETLEQSRLELTTWVEWMKAGLAMVGLSRPPSPVGVSAPGTASTADVQFVCLDPRLIVATDPGSAPHTSAAFLMGRQGGISLWVDVPAFGHGLRQLVNNRYLFAHAETSKSPYRNVISLSRGPRVYDPPTEPRWRVWLVNDDGAEFLGAYEDTEEIRTGWHLFVLRWNHDLPSLQLLIDGVIRIDSNDYAHAWPSKVAETALFGSWPRRSQLHYLNGQLARAATLRSWPGEQWLNEELRNNPGSGTP